MQIESVNIINLKRRTDLREKQIETWTALGYDREQIVFHDAMDGMNYTNKADLARDAISDGFRWFRRYFAVEHNHWMGLGEMACLWSIARLLRHLSAADAFPLYDKRNVYLYVLADRYSKLSRTRLDSILNSLPNDFRFLQFRGHVPDKEHHLHRERWRETPDFVNITGLSENSIERGALKIGDGVIAMTREGAIWMQNACEDFLIYEPYEVALYFATLCGGVGTSGIYSTYTQSDEIVAMEKYYGGFEAHQWEGQYPYDSELGVSDIARVNHQTGTGQYGNEWGVVDA